MNALAIGNVGVIVSDDDGTLWTIDTIWASEGLISVIYKTGKSSCIRTINADDFWVLIDKL